MAPPHQGILDNLNRVEAGRLWCHTRLVGVQEVSVVLGAGDEYPIAAVQRGILQAPHLDVHVPQVIPILGITIEENGDGRESFPSPDNIPTTHATGLVFRFWIILTGYTASQRDQKKANDR